MKEALNRIEATYRSLLSQVRPILKLFSGNPNEQGFRFPQEILEEVYHRYFLGGGYQPHPKGLRIAREAISKFYQGKGARIDPENIILTSGTSESFFYLFSLLGQSGDNILAPCPTYPLFDEIAKLAGLELRHYPLLEEKEWAVDLEELRRRTDEHTRGVVIISPNNPTGAVTSTEEIREIVSWVNRKEIPLICDEVFSEFYFGDGPFPRPMAIVSPRLCFTLNGISKMFALPALKLGWIVVTGEKTLVERAVDHLETIADTFLSCHLPIQEALPLLFSEGMGFLQSYREEVGKRRRLAIDLLRHPAIRFVEPVGGFYLMAEVAEGAGHFLQGGRYLAEEDFVIRLMEETGVFVHPGYFYDYERGIHIVISFLTKPDELDRGLKAALDFIRAF